MYDTWPFNTQKKSALKKPLQVSFLNESMIEICLKDGKEKIIKKKTKEPRL